MKQWLSKSVSYGLLLRIFTIYTLALLIIVSAIIAIFNLGGSRWTALPATIFTVIGLLIAAGQWLIPLPTESVVSGNNSQEVTLDQALGILHKQEQDRLRANPLQEVGILLVVTGKEKMLTTTVYLLPRGEFFKYRSSSDKRDHHTQKKSGTITTRRIGSHPLFVARFGDLAPGRYTAWIGYGVDRPKSFDLQIDKSAVVELLLQ